MARDDRKTPRKKELERSERKGKRVAHRWWRRKWFSWPLAGMVVAGCAGAVSLSDLFSARHIEVDGVSHLARAEVRRLAGVGSDTNVAWLDTAAVEARLERARWIADATVWRSLPSTLHIEVAERSPIAQVQQDDGWWLVASDGTLLDRAEEDPGLSEIGVSGGVPLRKVGDRPAALRLGTAPLTSLAPWLLEKISRVEVNVEGTILLNLTSGVEVVYGDPADADAKARALAGVLRWANRTTTRLARIDVRAPVSPAALPWSEALTLGPETTQPETGASDVPHGRGGAIVSGSTPSTGQSSPH